MSTTVKYKGSTLTSINGQQTKKLDTKGTWLEDDIIITDTSPLTGYVWQDENGYVHLSDKESGSSWELLASQDFTINTTSTSNTSVGSITLDLSKYVDPETLVWVHIRDKAGKRAGYLYGSDSIFFNYQLKDDNLNSLSIRPIMLFYVNDEGKYNGVVSAYGVFAYRLYYTTANHRVDIYSRYNTNYGTIDGTFKCDVYALKLPSGIRLFDMEV